MNTTGKVCLEWKDFSNNLISTFSELREDQNLLDVTLACEDGTQIEVHKVILTAGSLFFKNIPRMKKKENLIIFMRGLKSSILASVVDFLYYGEVNILQEELNDFLILAEELQLQGLVADKNKNEDDLKLPVKNNTIKQICNVQKKVASNIQNSIEVFPKQELYAIHEMPNLISYDTSFKTPQTAEISLDEDSNTKITTLIKQIGKHWICKVCGKVANIKRDLQRHTQTHTDGLSYNCNICGMEYGRKVYLDKHISKQHNDN